MELKMKRIRNERDVIVDLQRQRRPYHPVTLIGDQIAIAERHNANLLRHAELREVSFLIPSTGKTIKLNITDDPPTNPRLTWLLVSCVWALAKVQSGEGNVVRKIIDIEHIAHQATAADWVALLDCLGDTLQQKLVRVAEQKKAIDGKG
jgi:hypothetical protein